MPKANHQTFKAQAAPITGIRVIEDPEYFEGAEVRFDICGVEDPINGYKSIIRFNTPTRGALSFHVIHNDDANATCIGIVFETHEQAQAYADEVKQSIAERGWNQ